MANENAKNRYELNKELAATELKLEIEEEIKDDRKSVV